MGHTQNLKLQTEADISALIRKLKDKNEDVVENAHQALVKLKPQVIPVAVDMLKNEKTCVDRMLAAEVLIDLDPKNQALVPALVKIAKGRTASSSEDELICRRDLPPDSWPRMIYDFSAFGGSCSRSRREDGTDRAAFTMLTARLQS